MDRYIVKIPYKFYAKDTMINGLVYVPVINNKFYKPIDFTINSGVLCDDYLRLNGAASASKREFKTDIIKNYAIAENRIGMYKVIKEYRHKRKIGYVSIASLLSGYNTNKNANLFIDLHKGNLKNAKLGILLKNPKSYPGSLKNAKEINFNDFNEQQYELMKHITDKYGDDFNSVTEISGGKDE